jgi:alkanesulfonate monooxygenase SsuD/methylene tetrahydromethanopterin reductase-like flavin-dependent oxidoreductase (luciferase family)
VDRPLEYAGELFQISGYSANWATAPVPLVYAAASKPQMLRMAARVADGVMLSDVTLPRIAETMAILRARLDENSRSRDAFPVSNLYAWHVKADREEAMREARAKLFVRGMLDPWYISPFLSDRECRFVDDNLGAFAQAYVNNSPVIEGIPAALVDELVDNLTFAGDMGEIDRFIEQLLEFRAAGLTEFAIRLYGGPEDSMRVIAERVMPALA